MRVPGRLNIHWTDDNTLQLDTDSGTQTRSFRFGGAAPPSGQAPSLQGSSVASWEFLGARGRGAGVPKGTGQLRVRTTQMSGDTRRNGVPYSENASLDEYFDTFTEPNGDTWLVVTSIVTDPRHLTQPYTSTVPFKKILTAKDGIPRRAGRTKPAERGGAMHGGRSAVGDGPGGCDCFGALCGSPPRAPGAAARHRTQSCSTARSSRLTIASASRRP